MFCGKCGNMVKDGLRFCPKCGKEFEVKEDINLQSGGADLKYINNCAEDNYENTNSENFTGIQKVSAQKDKEKTSIGTRILSILLCIFLFIFSMTAILTGISRSVLGEENIRNLCSEIDVTQVKVNYNNKNIGIAEFILEMVSDKLINKYNLTESRINELIDNDTVKNHLENVIVDYVGFIAFGNDSEYLNTSGIIGIIQDCSKIVRDEIGYVFTENDYQELEYELNNGSMKFLTITGVKDLVYFDISIISVLLSLPMFIVYIVLAVGMLVLLLLINKWKFKYLFSYAGMTFSIQGAILILGSLAMLIFSLLSELYLANILIHGVIIYVLLSGLGLFAIGLVMFIIYCKIFKKI